MSFVIDPPEVVTLPVHDSEDAFPVGQIFCVGRNYADHAIEMGGDPDREPPFFFIKPAFAILQSGAEMIYPGLSEDVHHEVELVVAIGRGARNISVESAMSLVFGYGVGVDMTRRDLQAQAKEQRRPWEAGKSFVHAAPCSTLVRIEDTGNLDEADISLTVNDELRQQGNVNQMIWKVPEVISRLSELFILQPGDLIYTGTPAGVGPIQPGDRVNATVSGVPELTFNVRSS